MFRIAVSIFKACAVFFLMTTFLFPGRLAAEGDVEKVRIAVTRYIGDAHNYIAFEKGLFKKHGLDAELVINKTGLESIRQLLRGEVDFAMITPTPIIFSAFDPMFFLRGTEPDPAYAIIANLMQSPSLNSVVVATDRGVKTPKDLEGKSIAMRVGTGSEYYWYAYTVYHGIDHAKVRIVDAKINEMGALLESGNADAFTLWDPITVTVRQQLTIPTVELPAQKIYSNGRLVVVRKDFASQHTAIIEKYLRAIYDSERILQTKTEEVTQIMSPLINVSKKSAATMQEKMTFNLSLDESLLFNMSEQAKWVRRTKYDSSQPLPDFRPLLFEKPLVSVKPGGVNFIK